MIGQTISNYKILDKLGEGGMGIVYKAHDTKLDREVALKFLPHYVASSDTERARFLQEAKAAATLNHPNVCVIYDIQEADDQQFIVMEYVDGMTVKQKFSESPLKISDAISYAVQIGEALQEAHAKGIVHRDVKSENIMINSKNQIKVMDFGLAKLRGSVKLTKSSSTTGTLAYMAPEQIQGQEIDARADIFSFGVVLYEMLTGNTPFRGEHEAAMMYSILNEEPQPIQKFREDISSELLHVLHRALEKDPEERYQTVKDMTIDLRRMKKESTRVMRTQDFGSSEKSGSKINSKPMESALPMWFSKKYITGAGILLLIALTFVFREYFFSGSTAKNEKKTMVVLPFENLGPSDKDYFVDGMTDEITSRLSGVSGLGVIARTSAMQYKGTSKTFKQIGEELGVNFILQGTVRWETLNGETHVRVNPTVIKVEDGTQAWSQSMESVLSSAFKLQSDIASKVASALNVALLKSEKQTLETALTHNSEAYDYYLKAVQYSERSNSLNDMEIGIQLLNRAIQLDPSFAAAYAKLSYVHSNIYWFYYDRSESRVEESRIAAERAIQLAPQLSETRAAMAWYYYHGKLDYENALEQFSLALKYRPNNPDVDYGVAAVLRRQGKMKESVEAFKRSIAGNPRVAEIVRQLGETLTLTRDYEEADTYYSKAILLSPDNIDVYYEKAKSLLLWKSDLAGARKIVEDGKHLGKVGGETDYLNYLKFLIELSQGNFNDAEDALKPMSSSGGLSDQFQFYPTSLLRAQLETLRGNKQIAAVWFDSARIFIEQHLKTNPYDERGFSSLGIALAGLSQKENAIRAGLRGVELLPIEKEAWRGAFRIYDLAKIYALTGEQDKAVNELERLLSIPSETSTIWLKADPAFVSLRGNKRFQKLVSGKL
ncbi:protein kinase [bacterium]|nr:MAG: protein kinase [bacterium]